MLKCRQSLQAMSFLDRICALYSTNDRWNLCSFPLEEYSYRPLSVQVPRVLKLQDRKTFSCHSGPSRVGMNSCPNDILSGFRAAKVVKKSEQSLGYGSPLNVRFIYHSVHHAIEQIVGGISFRNQSGGQVIQGNPKICLGNACQRWVNYSLTVCPNGLGSDARLVIKLFGVEPCPFLALISHRRHLLAENTLP